MLDPNLFEVTRDGERWTCRPSMVVVRFGLVLGIAMSVFLAYLSWTSWRNDEGMWFGAVILLIAVFMAALTTWRWWIGRTPLTVERAGRVCYGGQELCAAGKVRSVRVAPTPSGEDAYDVWLELDGGRILIPGFAYGSRDNALAFAQELAHELRVPVEAAGNS
jgi:hypothetical protein